jgi:hypothetical protein
MRVASARTWKNFTDADVDELTGEIGRRRADAEEWLDGEETSVASLAKPGSQKTTSPCVFLEPG